VGRTFIDFKILHILSLRSTSSLYACGSYSYSFSDSSLKVGEVEVVFIVVYEVAVVVDGLYIVVGGEEVVLMDCICCIGLRGVNPALDGLYPIVVGMLVFDLKQRILQKQGRVILKEIYSRRASLAAAIKG
jgi:hypothetical protein